MKDKTPFRSVGCTISGLVVFFYFLSIFGLPFLFGLHRSPRAGEDQLVDRREVAASGGVLNGRAGAEEVEITVG